MTSPSSSSGKDKDQVVYFHFLKDSLWGTPIQSLPVGIFNINPSDLLG